MDRQCTDADVWRMAQWMARGDTLLEAKDLYQAAQLFLLEHAAQPRKQHPRAVMQAMWDEQRQWRQQQGFTRRGTVRQPTVPVWRPAPPAAPWLVCYLQEVLTHMRTCAVGRAQLRCLTATLRGEDVAGLQRQTQITYVARARRHLRRWQQEQACQTAPESETAHGR